MVGSPGRRLGMKDGCSGCSGYSATRSPSPRTARRLQQAKQQGLCPASARLRVRLVEAAEPLIFLSPLSTRLNTRSPSLPRSQHVRSGAVPAPRPRPRRPQRPGTTAVAPRRRRQLRRSLGTHTTPPPLAQTPHNSAPPVRSSSFAFSSGFAGSALIVLHTSSAADSLAHQRHGRLGKKGNETAIRANRVSNQIDCGVGRRGGERG